METVISNEDRIAIAEVDYIIHHMNERYLSKIPQKIQDYITISKKRNIKIYVDPHQPLEKQGLKRLTLYFLMILNLKYWCDDARRKDILLMLEQNQREFDEKVNNIFDSANAIEGNTVEASARPVNKPRQIIVTASPTSSEKESEQAVLENQEVKIEEKTGNALDNLAKESQAIASVKQENFFTRFINKIKSILIRK